MKLDVAFKVVVLNALFKLALSSIEFVNGPTTVPQAVAVGTTSLQFKSTNLIPDITRVFDWSLTIRDTIVNIHYGRYNQSSGTCENLETNKTFVISTSCHQYNDTHFTSVINLGPIPEDVTLIAFEIPGFHNRPNRTITSKYCPVVNTTLYMAVTGDIKAVYNQQARFNCSKGELYDGSSINPDYYRTCQFDATWSGEMPQCWIAPNASITTPDKLISQQNVSFPCEVTEGNPKSFNITFNLIQSNIVSKYDVGINHNVVLPVVLTPDMNGAELVCKVRNAYKEAVVKKTLNVLYGPISNYRVLYAEAKYGKPLNVSHTFTANPTINGTTTNLTKFDVNTTIVNTTYQIRSLGGINHVFEWKIDNFTNEYEGNYTFTAWSVSAPEVLMKSFELKMGSSSTTLPPTIPNTTPSGTDVTSGGISTGLLIAIAAGGSVLLIAVIVIVCLMLRKRGVKADHADLTDNSDEGINDTEFGNEKVEKDNPIYGSNTGVSEKEDKSNPIYDSGGDAIQNTEGIYQQIDKSKNKSGNGETSSSDVYAQVNKPAKSSPSDVYAQVNKPNNKKGVENNVFQQDNAPVYAAVQKKK